MWFRLALGLGIPLAELRRRITYREFAEWCIYYTIEPWGFESDAFHAALIASTVDNCRQTSKRRMKFAKISDYMPLHNRAQKKKGQTCRQMVDILRHAAALGHIKVNDKLAEKEARGEFVWPEEKVDG